MTADVAAAVKVMIVPRVRAVMAPQRHGSRHQAPAEGRSLKGQWR